MSRRILVTAKAPLPGVSKTRLCPPLGLGLAARLAAAFLIDVLAAARSVDPGAGLLARPEDVDELGRRFPDVPVVAQAGTGLAAALEDAVRTGATVVSGDAPGYRVAAIRQGFESRADIVLGPAHDGGYCLIGMRRFHSSPFRDVAWSTGLVLDQTVRAARAAGLSVEFLEPHGDVDTADDLLAVDLASAPATAALLADPDVRDLLPRASKEVRERVQQYASPWRRLLIDRLDTGETYSYLETPPAVWVVPVTDGGETMLVRQYRHPVGSWPLEVPAGSLEPGEQPASAAARELREEVGGVARELRRVGGFYSSSAHLSLRGLVYVATGVEFRHPTQADREGLELVRMPFARAAELARQGELCEAQSALALIQAEHALGCR